ncbi:MAG: DUF362 domain-containing protein [Chloroflexi bacterium]|nr:DUF362 domain-containing protein [Chloroflexota bacterium]
MTAYDAAKFALKLPPEVTFARRVLVKPCAAWAKPYPVTTAAAFLGGVIAAIRRVSEADIILLEGGQEPAPMKDIYKALGYDFPRVMLLDSREGVAVEVENPLLKPFALTTFWVPNIVLSCDYLISVAPYKVLGRRGSFVVENLLGLLPSSRYRSEPTNPLGLLSRFDLQHVIADLYFTLPFDLGIIDARQRLFCSAEDPTTGEVDDYGKVFVGEPFQVDKEAAAAGGIETPYLRLIEAGRAELRDAPSAPGVSPS